MKKSNFFWVLAIAMMALTQSVWALDPHFYLIGSFTGNNWSGDVIKNYPINVNYESGKSKYCIEVDVVNNTTYYFALFNGDNRYAPLGDKKEDGSYGQNKVLNAGDLLNYDVRTVCASQGKGADAWYKQGDKNDKPQDVGNNSWQITANYTGKLLICVDEENGQEWYPYVWLERPNNYCVIGDAISGISGDYWNVNNSSCPLVSKNADGKYYVNLYLKKDSYFALTYSGKRFAPSTSPVSVYLNTVKDTVYDGSCTNGQDNSWKYEGETGLVRLVLDVENKTFTLEPWQMYLIGAPAQVQGEIGTWDVKNTSTPLSTPYVNAEGNIEAGKFYREVLLDKDACFAFSDGILRYANNTATKNKDIKSDEAGQQGTYDSSKQDNSWKFVEASYVRVCIDYTSSPKPYIWLEEICPKEIRPIGGACSWGWAIDKAVPLTRKADTEQVVYSGTLTLKAGELKFLCQQSFDKHYGPATNGVAMDTVGEYDITLLSSDTDNKWSNTLVGDYIVTLNVETLKLTVEKPGPTTLVEQTSVVNDNIVYDIMGRALGTSLENLPQGIYVRNGKKFVVAQ